MLKMIEIIDTGHYQQDKKRIETFYQNTRFDFKFILDNPHQLIMNDQAFTLNFNSPNYQRLIKQQHPILTAIGKKPISVLDAFGGLGKDGFILAHQGHKVTTYEINPILYLLLSQALANYSSKLNWEIHLGDISHHLKEYDVIYFDPMFETDSSSKPKLAMQVIQNIVTDQSFTAWEQALSMATKKLVIKQHQSNPPIKTLPKPSIQVKGKRNVRYDVYLKT